MADEIIIETTSAEVIEVGVPGPQGPQGAAGTGLETLTVKGDTLYRGETTGQRLPIGTAGQILKVSAGGIPEWGAAPASGVSSVNGETGAVLLDSTSIFTEQALQISDAGIADCNGVFVYGGLFNGRPTYYATKDTFVYWDGSNWVINHNGDDQYFGTATTLPWQAVWSLGDGANPLPVVTQAASHEFEQVVGQRTNPTALGTASSKNVGTGANDVAAGNHTHSSATQSVAGFLSTTDKTKLDGIATGAEVNVNADWNASSGDAQILNKPTSLTPTSHADSHAAAGSDPLAPSDIGAQSIFVTEDLGTVTANVTLTAARAKIYLVNSQTSGLSINLPTTSIMAGDVVQIRFTSFTGETLAVRRNGSFYGSSLINGQQATYIAASTSANSWEEAANNRQNHGNITNEGRIGTISGLPVQTSSGGLVSVGAFGTSAGQFSEGNHTHGNLTNDGKVGSTSGLPLVTTTAGAVTTLALGTAGQILRTKSDLSGVEFADLSGGGVTGAAASASDVLGVSGANITGVDAGSDKIVFWDDSASALKYLEAGSGLSISGTTMTVTATGGATNLWIPASAWIPRTTTGCGVDSREQSTNKVNTDELLFDTATEEYAQALVVMPSNYNNGTVTARFYWTAASGSGGVAWGISGRAYGDDDPIDAASGTRVVVADTFIAANDVHVTSATSAVTIAGTPAANKAVNFQIVREVGNASDTLGVDARLLGVEIIFN